jgi:hypothetical protein
MRARVNAEARTRNKGARRTRDRWAEGTAVGWFSRQVPETSIVDMKWPGKWPGKLFSAAAACFFCVVKLVPPTFPRGDGGARIGGKSLSVSQDASKPLKLLQDVLAMVRSVLQMHKK